jgi:predicted nucleotidyltransferase
VWTRFRELDEVLRQLVTGVREVLGGNLVGVYLQGSFAVGDADVWSDADFIVVTRTPLEDLDRPALDALHHRLFALPGHWPKHLEGSYIDRELLRRSDSARTKLLFLCHGSQELAWDDHCNTGYVRWVLREHGIALTGPPTAELVDPVTADILREEGWARLPEWVGWAFESAEMSRWKQPFLVLTLCRILHTIETGTVVSKRVAGEWSMATLELEWGPLIQRALDDRPNPKERVRQRASPADVEQTRAFVRYASSWRS